MHSMGWAQQANYAQVRALAAGQAEIDRWHWETKDKAWFDGHFYSVKAPGLAAFTLPAYLALDAARRQVGRPRCGRQRQPGGPPALGAARAPRPEPVRVQRRSAPTGSRSGWRTEAPIVWALTLVGAVIPAVALLLLVRWVAERIEPGYGTAAAITLGLGTIVMTFAAEYFSHVIAATLGFAAFALLFREREGPARIGLVGAAGLLAGLAVSFEYPLGLLGAILFVYAVARPRLRLRASRRLRRRGRDRSRAGARLQPLGARIAASLRLLARGRRPGAHRSRGAGAQLERLLRDRPAAPGRGDRPAARQPRPADPDAGARDGRRRRDHDAPARASAPRQP